MIKLSRSLKSDWASVVAIENDSVLVGLPNNHTKRFILFSDYEKFKSASTSGQLKVKKWVVAVPRRLCIVKPLTLPAQSFAEAQRMAEFELAALSPIPVEEAVYACWPLEQQQGQMHIMVCILKSKTLIDYLAPMRSLGIEPDRIVVSTLALSSAIQNDPIFDDTRQQITVMLSGRQSEIMAHREKSITATLSIQADDNISDCQARQFVCEIGRQVKPALRETHNNIQLLLKGSDNDIKHLKKHLNGQFKSHQVQRLCSNHDVSPYDINGVVIKNPNEYELLLAEGLIDLVKQDRWPYFNLLQSEVLQKQSLHQRRRSLFLILSLMILVIFLSWMMMWTLNWRQQQRCKQIESLINPLKQTAGQVEDKLQQVDTIIGQFAHRQHLRGILIDLFKHTPKSISFSSVAYKDSPEGLLVRFKGQADSLASAFGYTENMRQAKYLNMIQIENVQQISRSGVSLVEFKGSGYIKLQ